LGYSAATRWNNHVEFASNRQEAQAPLARKWNKEHKYRLIKQLWAFAGNRIAVHYAFEYCDDSGQWLRAYGNETGFLQERACCRIATPASTRCRSPKRIASSNGRSASARTITRP
jgi:nuclear transport factor 2 (NTF2) superfamily protein